MTEAAALRAPADLLAHSLDRLRGWVSEGREPLT
jgi:hypothetical protein